MKMVPNLKNQQLGNRYRQLQLDATALVGAFAEYSAVAISKKDQRRNPFVALIAGHLVDYNWEVFIVSMVPFQLGPHYYRNTRFHVA